MNTVAVLGYGARVMTATARRFHALLEPVAATVFFVPEATDEYARLGLNAVQGYFCSRAAPMGRVSPAVVVAAFYSFHPTVVSANLRWDIAGPDAVVAARTRAAGEAMRRLLTDENGSLPDVGRALDVLRGAVGACGFAGRPLAAAHAALRWPEDAATALWHASAVLREHRGDGHIAVLVSHGVTPAEALVLDAAYAKRKPPAYFAFHGVPDAETSVARARLQDRGYLDAGGSLTDGGAKFREMIEMETDRLAAPAYTALSEDDREGAIRLLDPLVRRICERRGVPRFVAALAGYAPVTEPAPSGLPAPPGTPDPRSAPGRIPSRR